MVECEWCHHHHCGGIWCCMLVWVDGFGVSKVVREGLLGLVTVSESGLAQML